MFEYFGEGGGGKGNLFYQTLKHFKLENIYFNKLPTFAGIVYVMGTCHFAKLINSSEDLTPSI